LGEFNILQSEYYAHPLEVLGEEFVGFVREPGSNTEFKVGEEVVGWIFEGGEAHDGAYPQFVICHKRRLYHLSLLTSFGCDSHEHVDSIQIDIPSGKTQKGTDALDSWREFICRNLGSASW
jgi:hypothetical protein